MGRSPSPNPEDLARTARRRALVVVLRAHPTWTIEQVLTGSKLHGHDLASLTVAELCEGEQEFGISSLYEQAMRRDGVRFDEFVYKVLAEAEEPVQTRYLRARLGGPRWEVKAALERLCSKGRVARTGVTSDSFYEITIPR